VPIWRLEVGEVVWKVFWPTIFGWQGLVFISDPVPMPIRVAGMLYTFDRGTKRLSKAD
jgi:hypothetical protein